MVDTDCTGKLSKSEWLAKYGNDDEFGEADQDQDGVIDLNEFLAYQATRAKRDLVRVPRSPALRPRKALM